MAKLQAPLASTMVGYYDKRCVDGAQGALERSERHYDRHALVRVFRQRGRQPCERTEEEKSAGVPTTVSIGSSVTFSFLIRSRVFAFTICLRPVPNE